MPKALSATIPELLEARARAIARQENRSLSNVVENALGVFTALPKDLRDQLVARLATGGPDDAALRDASRALMFALARQRFTAARDSIVAALGKEPEKLDPAMMNIDNLRLTEEPQRP